MVKVHLLDVGTAEYGDAVLCELGDRRIIIDGGHQGDFEGSPGHDSIPKQLDDLLGGQRPHDIDLIVVSHAHDDHIGCMPELVSQGVIKPAWALLIDAQLGWGRSADDADDAPLDQRVARVVAALREEPLSPDAPDSAVLGFMDALVDVETRYTQMIASLRRRHVSMVRHGRDSDLQPLHDEFADVGLNVLGPTPEFLLFCANEIHARTKNGVDAVSDQLEIDANTSLSDLYRRLSTDVGDDAADASPSRPGNFVNLQSSVISFHVEGVKLLFGGDSQLVIPGSAKPEVTAERDRLVQAITADGPYTWAKLGHHGSPNSVGEALLSAIGAKVVGICAGSRSNKHPDGDVLQTMAHHIPKLKWARTDRNGQCTFHFRNGRASTIDVQIPGLSRTTPHGPDLYEPSEAGGQGGVPETPAPTPITVSRTEGEVVEVIARIPNRSTTVRITVEIDGANGEAAVVTNERDVAPEPIKVGGGRQLPHLLVVTNRSELANNLGRAETADVLAAIAATGAEVLDVASGPDPAAALAQTRQALTDASIEGVVLLGGYDVVPPLRLDTLPTRLRERLGSRTNDQDNFIVWSDDAYGDRDSDRIPELPVSRIPDGRSPKLVHAALSAGQPETVPAWGVRNDARPFAEAIYAALPQGATLLLSNPTAYSDQPPPAIVGNLVYLMLHGHWADGSRFWGDPPGIPEAVNVHNISSIPGATVFAGCCWGALVGEQPAWLAPPGQVGVPKLAENSMALTFLQNGARAFVGCTGVHYSPVDEPYDYFGGPMHESFWRHVLAGEPPAQALFNAKQDYSSGIPHGSDHSEWAEAVEYKIWRQFTCLGLGW